MTILRILLQRFIKNMNIEIVKISKYAGHSHCAECKRYIEVDKNAIRLSDNKKISRGTFHYDCFKKFCERGITLLSKIQKYD